MSDNFLIKIEEQSNVFKQYTTVQTFLLATIFITSVQFKICGRLLLPSILILFYFCNIATMCVISCHTFSHWMLHNSLLSSSYNMKKADLVRNIVK